MKYQPLFTYYIKVSKMYYFLKNVLKGRSEDNTFFTLLDLLESWIFQNYWTAILFIIFLIIVFEIIIIKIYTSFQKKPVLLEKGSSNSQENEGSCLKKKSENRPTVHPSLKDRADIFSGQCTSSLTSEENEGNFEGRILSSDEIIWASSNVSDYEVNHFCESHVPSSVGTSSSLSLFHNKAREIFLIHKQHPENEPETVQFSSKELFSIMKTNKNKNMEFPSDLRHSKTSSFTVENEDLDVASHPSAHLILSKDQLKLLEENVRNKISLKPKAVLENKTIYPCSGSQESLNQNQFSVEMVISTEAQDSFPEQNTIQNKEFYEVQFPSQAQQLIHNQERINSKPDIQASCFAQPQDLMWKSFPSSTHDSFQDQDMDKSQNFTEVPCIVNTQDSSKGLESDEYLDEAQYSKWFEDSKEIKYSIKGQNSALKNAESLVLSLNSVAEDMPQLKGIMPEGWQQISSSQLNQYSVRSSMPLSPTITGQKNRTKTSDNKSKLGLKVPSLKAKKSSQVFQIAVCHISKNRNELEYENNCEKKEIHQRKSILDMVLHSISVSKLITPDIKKYSSKKLVTAMTDLIKCGYSLNKMWKQNKSPDTEKINYAGSVERGISGIIKNVSDKENEIPKDISPEMLPQLEQSFVVNTNELKVPCSLLETDWKNKESLKISIKQILDLTIPEHEITSEEAMSEPKQKPSSLKRESKKEMEVQECLQSAENSHLQLSDEEFWAGTPDRQRCFLKENTKQQDFLRIVLELSDISFLIFGGKKHKSSEELEDIKIQVSTESVNLNQKKPLILNILESGDLSESKELENSTGSKRKTMHKNTRTSDAFCNVTYITISEPADVEMHGKLKAKTDSSTLNGLTYSALKQEKLPNEKKAEKSKYIETSSVFKKPHQCDSEQEQQEEEKQNQEEEVPPLTQEVRLSIHLKPMLKYFKVEMEQIRPRSKKTQNKNQEVDSQTLSTQTVRCTSSCPMTSSLQVEKTEQNTYRPTGRETTTDLVNPVIMLENLPVGEYLIETTESGVPFGGNLKKTLDDHMTEEKEDLKRDLSAVTLGPFEIRKILSDTEHVLSVKHVIMKVKKPVKMLYVNRHNILSHRKNWGDNFEIIIKQMLQSDVSAEVLPDVGLHISILPNTEIHSRLNAENNSDIKLIQEKSQVEGKEKYLDSTNEKNEPPNTLEPKWEDEVKKVKEAIPPDSWDFISEPEPVKKIKTVKEMHHPIPFTETTKEPIYASRMDSLLVDILKRRLAAQTDFQGPADMELPPLESGKSPVEDTLNQTKRSSIPSTGSDTGKIPYCFAKEKAELLKDLPAISPEPSQNKKNRLKFANAGNTMKYKPIKMKVMKASVSQSIIDHGKKSGLDFKANIKKVNQAEKLVTEYLNDFYSPIHRKLQEEFCHTQLKQGKPVSKNYVDLFVKTSDREEKVQDKEEEEKESSLEAALQHCQHVWPDAGQMEELHLDESNPPLICLTQELPINGQDVQHQTEFSQATLEDIKVPLSPKAENLPLDECSDTATEYGFTSGRNPKKDLDSYSMEENSEILSGLQVTCLQPSDSTIMAFISESKGQKKALKLARNQTPMSHTLRTMTEVKPSISLMLNVKYSKELQSSIKMMLNDLQQRNNVADAFLDIIHFTVPILSQIKMRINLNMETDMQNEAEKQKNCVRSSPLKYEEAMVGVFSAREDGVQSYISYHKEQVESSENKETTALDFYISTLPTSERKRKFRRSSDMKTSVNHKCGILKVKKLPISYILNIKDGASPKKRKILGYTLTTKTKDMNEGKKMIDKMYSLMPVTPDININSKIETEKGTPGESVSSLQVKQEISQQEGTMTSVDTQETNLQDQEEEENEQEALLKVIPQYSQHFIFCSGESKDLDFCKLKNPQSRRVLFVTEQDVPQETQPSGPAQGEEPKDSLQTQNDMLETADSKPPLLKSEVPPDGEVSVDTIKGDIATEGKHLGKSHSLNEEEKAEFKSDPPATLLESLNLFTPDLPESKRQRKTLICRALKSKTSPTCVMIKARKVPISKIFNIPQYSCRKNIPPDTLITKIIEFLPCSRILSVGLYMVVMDKPIAEKKKRLNAQELRETIIESLNFSSFALPASERESDNLKLMDKKYKLCPKCVILKAKKVPISKTLKITGCSIPGRRRQFSSNSMTKQNTPVAYIFLNAICSLMPASLNIRVCNRIKETETLWKTRLSDEQQEQPAKEKRALCTCSIDRGIKGPKDIKDQDGEAARLTFQQLNFDVLKIKKSNFGDSELEVKNSEASNKPPEVFTTAQDLELQQKTLVAPSESNPFSYSILNSFPFEKLPKRAKSPKGINDTWIARTSSPMPGKSTSELLIVTTKDHMPLERGPGKEFASSTLEGNVSFQNDLKVRTLEPLDSFIPTSSEVKVFERHSIPRCGALSHRKQKELILENMAQEISQDMANISMNIFSSTPVSPGIIRHKKVETAKSLLRKPSNITQLEQEKLKKSYTYPFNKWSISSDTLEGRWQNKEEEVGTEILFETRPQFLSSAENRKDQSLLIPEKDIWQGTLATENVLESICSPVTPFQTRKLKKNIPLQKSILYKTSERAPFPKSEKATFDGTEYSTSDESPIRILEDSTVSLQLEGIGKNINTQKMISYTVDQNIPPTNSGDIIFGSSCDENSVKKLGGYIAKKHEEVQRDLPTMRTVSALNDAQRQKNVLSFLERQALMSPKHITMKAKKQFCLQMQNITKHGNLYHREKQESNSSPKLNDIQQNKGIINTFLSSIPISTSTKINSEMHNSLKAEIDRPRLNIYSHMYSELEKSLHDRKAQKANLTDRQSRPSHAMKMNVQHQKTEETTPKMTSESVPCCGQHFRFSAYQLKDLSTHKPEPDLKGSEGRQAQNFSFIAQEANQETHLRETLLEPLSKHMTNFLQIKTVKKDTPMQERIKSIVDLRALPGGISWDKNPRRKWKSPISRRTTWNQEDLRRALKPLDLSSLVASESKSETYTWRKKGKKSRMGPKNITFKAKQPPISKLLHITRYPLKGHRIKGWHSAEKMREIKWYGSVRQALLSAMEDFRSQTPRSMIDKLSFDTTTRGTPSNRTLQKAVDGHLAEFFMPALSSSKSQVLPKNEMILICRCLTMKKKKKTPISRVLKLSGYFTTKHSKKFESNLKTKIKAMWQGRNMTDTSPNTVYFFGNKRQKNLKTKIDTMGSRFNHSGKEKEQSVNMVPFHIKNTIVSEHPRKEIDPGKSEGKLFGEFFFRKSQIYEGNLGGNVKIGKSKNVQGNLSTGVFKMEKPYSSVELSKPTGGALSGQYDVKRIDHYIVKEEIPYHFAGTVTDSAGRHLSLSQESKRQTDSLKIPGMPNPKGRALQVTQSSISQLLNPAGHAAVNISKNQKQTFKTPKIKVERHKAVLYAEIKSIYASMPILLRMKMKHSPSTRDTYEKPSEKRDAPNRANIGKKETYGQQFLFRRAPQYISPFEIFGAEQMRVPDPFKSKAALINIVYPKIITPRKTEIYLIDLEAKMKVVKQFRPKSIFLSKIHALQIENQKNTFKTANRKRVTNPKILALQKKQQESCISGAVQGYPNAYLLRCRKIIRHEDKAEMADVTRHTKQVKLKAKRTLVSQLLGYSFRNNKKEQRRNIQQQQSFQLSKNVTQIVPKNIFYSECSVSHVKKLTEMKVEKDKLKERISIFSQRKLEKPLTEKQMSLSGCLSMSNIIGKLQENIKEAEKFHQTILAEMQQQDVQPLSIRPQKMKQRCVRFEHVPKKVCSEPISQKDDTDCVRLDHVKSKVDLEREVHPILFSQNKETNYSRLDTPRTKTDTKLESLIAQGVKQRIVDFTERSVLIQRGSKKMDISLSSKRQDVLLTRWDAFQQTTFKKQKLLKPENISTIDLESISCPIREPLHLENTKQVAKEGDEYLDRKNISHLSGRERLKETDILIGSKGQKLHTNLQSLHKTSTVQRRCVKPVHMSKSILDSVSSHNKDPLHLKNAVNSTRKQNSSISLSVSVNTQEKEQSELTGVPLKSNRQKVDFSKKLRAKQLNTYNTNKDMILESVYSCILHHIHIENAEKQVSTTAILQSKILNPVVEKASNEVSIPVDQPPDTKEINLCIRGSNEHQPENTCKSFPRSVTHPIINICHLTLPQIKKALKAVDVLGHHTSNAENVQQQKKYAFPQPESPFKKDLLQINIPIHQLKLDALNIMHHGYSTLQTRDPLKQMDITDGYTKEKSKLENQKHLSISYGNFGTHMSYPLTYPCLQTDLMPQAKEALSDVGNVSSRTKGIDMFSTNQLSTLYKYGLGCTVPSVTSRQIKKHNIMLPSESYSKTKKNLNHLSSKGKQSFDRTQVIKSISNSSSSKLRIRRKVDLHKAIQKEAYLPRIFLQSLSLCMSVLHEVKKQEDSIKQGVRKDIIYPQSGALRLDNIVSATDCDTPRNKIELQWNIKEKIINIKHIKGEPGLVVTKTYGPIPSLPYLGLEKEKIDGVISDNYPQQDRVKAVEIKGITNPNTTLKAGKPSLSSVLSRKELPVPLGIAKPQIKEQEDRDKSDVKLKNLCTPLPCLARPNLNSSRKLGKAKSGILKSCLPPLTPRTSSHIRRISFEKPTNNDHLSAIKESKYLPQKKEDTESMVDVKDIIGLICIILKGKKSPLKQLLPRKGPQGRTNEQKKMMQKDKKNLDVIENEPLCSISPLPHLECDPKIKEVYTQGLIRFCLPSLTLQELSNEMGVCEGSTNDILSSIKREKDRVEIASEEIHSERIALKVKQSSELQELQLKDKEGGEEMQEDKQVEIQRKSSISFLPYTKVDTRVKGDEAMQVKTRSFFLQPVLQNSLPIGTITCKKATSGPISSSAKNEIDHIVQKEEESVAEEKVIPMKKGESSISVETQMDVKEQEKKLQKIKEEPDEVVTDTNTYILSPSHLNLDTMVEKVDHVTEVTGNSLPELLHQKPADTVQEASKEYIESKMTSGIKGEEDEVKILTERDIIDLKDKGLEVNGVFSQDVPWSPGEMGPQGTGQGELGEVKEQEEADLEEMAQEEEEQAEMSLDSGEQGMRNQMYEYNGEQEGMYLGGQEQGKINPGGKSQEKMDLDSKNQRNNNQKIEQEKMYLSGQKQGKMDPEGISQEKIDLDSKEQGIWVQNIEKQGIMYLGGQRQGKFDSEGQQQGETEEEGKMQGKWGQEGQGQEKEGPESKEQEKRHQKGKDQGKMRLGHRKPETDLHKETSQEVVLHVYLPSNSSLTDNKVERKDTQGIIRSVSEKPLQKFLDARKIAQTKSVEFNKPHDVKSVQEYKAQKVLTRSKIVDMKDITHPEHATSNTSHLSLPHVPSHSGPQTREEQTNTKEKMEHVQEKKSEQDEILTLPSLPHGKLDKGIQVKEENKRVTRSFLPYSQLLEPSDAGKFNDTVSSLSDISLDSKRAEYMAHRGADKANVFKTVMYPEYRVVKPEKSPMCNISKVKSLPVNITEQKKESQEGSEQTVTPLMRKACSFTTSTHLFKLGTIKEEEEPGTMKNDESLPFEQITSTTSLADEVKKRTQPLTQEDRVQTTVMYESMHLHGTAFKTKTSAPPSTSCINEKIPLSKREEPQQSLEEKIRQKQERTWHPHVLTNICPFEPSPSHHGSSTSQIKLLMPSGIGKITQRDSSESLSSCNVTLKSSQHIQCKDEEIIVQMEHMEVRILPKRINLRANTLPPSYQYSKRKLPLNIEKQRKEVQEGGSELGMVLRKTYASLPSPSCLSRGTRSNKQEGERGGTQFSFPPLKIQDALDSDEKTYTRSVHSNRLSQSKGSIQSIAQKEEKDRLKIKIKEKNFPKYVDSKVEKLSFSHSLSTSELAWKIKEKKRKMEEDKNKILMSLANRIAKLSLSQLQSMESLDIGRKAHPEVTDGELSSDMELKEHMLQKENKGKEKLVGTDGIMETKDMDLKTKDSPILDTENLRNLQCKVREQEEEVREVKSEPNMVLTKTTAALLNVNTKIKEESTLSVTRSSFSKVNIQETPDSKGGISLKPVNGGIFISLPKGKQHVVQKKEEDGTEVVKIIMYPKQQEIKVQEYKDEPGVVLTKSLSSLPSLPHVKLDKKIELDDEMLRFTKSALSQISNAREIVPTQSICADIMEDAKNEKQHMPQKEEIDREKVVKKKSTEITLKSKKSPSSSQRHRTELHMNIKGYERKRQEGPGEPQDIGIRTIYIAKPSSLKLKSEKATQVDEEQPGGKTSSLLPLMLSALSDADKRAMTEAISGDVRKGKHYMSHKGKRYQLKTVDMRIGVHCKEGRTLPVSHIFNTKEFVLNMKVMEKKVCRSKEESSIVLSRTFLSIPSTPLSYLDLENKTDEHTLGMTRTSCSQQNLQDAQKPANRESVEGDSKSVIQQAGSCAPQKKVKQELTSGILISAQQRDDSLQVKSKRDLNSHEENIYFPGFGTMTSGKGLGFHSVGQKAQPERCKKELFDSFPSHSTMDAIKPGNTEEKTELIDNLNRKLSPKVSLSVSRKTSKGISVPLDTHLSSKGFSIPERGAYQQEPSSKVSLGSVGSCKPERDVQSNERSRVFSHTMLVTPTRRSLEKINIAKCSTPQNKEEQGIVMKKQVLSLSESGHMTRPSSVISFEYPFKDGKQKTSLEIDMDRKTTVYHTSLQMLPRIHMDITESNATKENEDEALLDSEQEECDPKLFPNSLNPSQTFLLESEHLEEKMEVDTNTTVCLEQKKIEIDNHSTVIQDEEKFEIDPDTVIYLEKDKVEVHSSSTANMKTKTRMDTSSTVHLHSCSSMAEESQIEAQANTHIENICPGKEEHNEDLELSSAGENTQIQRSFQRSARDPSFVHISCPLKCQTNRLTVMDLKRESSPKYLTMQIPNDPVSRIIDITRHSTPNNRMKLKCDFSKTKGMVSCGKNTNSGETVKRDTLTIIKGEQNFTDTVPQDSQLLVVNEQQMQKPPHVKSKASLQSKTNEKKLMPQTKERIVQGHGPLRILKKPDLHMNEQEEKIAKYILTPQEKYPFMFEDGREIVETLMKKTTCMKSPSPEVEPQDGNHLSHMKERPLLLKQKNWNKGVCDTSTQNVQHPDAIPRTVPTLPQVKRNETKTLSDSLSEECLFHIYEAIATVLESQMKNRIQDKVSSDKLKKVQAPKPDDPKSPSFPGGPDPSSTGIYPRLQHRPLLEHLIPEDKNKLTSHLETKALEIKLNRMPTTARTSLQMLTIYPEGAVAEESSGQVNPRFKKVNFMTSEEADTIEHKVECQYPKDSSPLRNMKTLRVNGSSSSKEIITEKRIIKKRESGASSVTLTNDISLPQVLQKYSVNGKDKLLMHFSMKTLEIQMKAPPKIVRESCRMASAEDRTTPLSNCIHSAVKEPKRKNRILLLFEEKSLRQIDLDLQHKYLRFLLGLSEESMFPKPNVLPKPIFKLNTISKCKKVDDNREHPPLSFDSELLEKHISFKKQSPHESSLLSRTCLEPTHMQTFDSSLHQEVQKATEALSNLKSHKCPEKNKCHHVCFKETNTYKPFDLRTKENATSFVDSHSIQINKDSTDTAINIENLAKLEKCPAPEVHDSEEYMFIEGNPYLNQESKNILLELQRGIPLENLYKKREVTTYLKSFFKEDASSHQIRACKNHSLITALPSGKSHKSRKYKSSSKMQSPDQLCKSSLNNMNIQYVSSSISISEGELSWTTESGTSYSLAPLTESNIKLHLAKHQNKPQVDLESKERKKARFDLFRKNDIYLDYNYRHMPSKEKLTRKKKKQDEESERSDYSQNERSEYYQSKHRSASKPHHEGTDSHYESKQNPPFFYACIPADSLEIIPQTIRWTIPQKTLRKRNFKVPMVANTSKSWNIWTSSKKLLQSLTGSFSPVHQS